MSDVARIICVWCASEVEAPLVHVTTTIEDIDGNLRTEVSAAFELPKGWRNIAAPPPGFMPVCDKHPVV